MPYFLFGILKKYLYLCIWLCWVLLSACRICVASCHHVGAFDAVHRCASCGVRAQAQLLRGALVHYCARDLVVPAQNMGSLFPCQGSSPHPLPYKAKS